MTSKRVLVTGSAGLVGTGVCAALTAAGDRVEPFDIVDGKDVLNGGMLLDAARGVDVIVHLAAVDDPLGDPDPQVVSPNTPGRPEDIMTTTIVGTSNVLTAARMAGHRMVVVMSSIDALGVFLGHGEPDYLPIDDRHEAHPKTPSALAKRIAERQCREFTQTSGISTICLRPAGVWTEDTIAMLRSRWARDPDLDHQPFWEYGAYVALEDLAELVRLVIHRPIPGHGVFNVAADDAALSWGSSRQAASRLLPDVPWRGGPEFDEDPERTLLDNTRVKSVFGWKPRIRFRSSLTDPPVSLASTRRPGARAGWPGGVPTSRPTRAADFGATGYSSAGPSAAVGPVAPGSPIGPGSPIPPGGPTGPGGPIGSTAPNGQSGPVGPVPPASPHPTGPTQGRPSPPRRHAPRQTVPSLVRFPPNPPNPPNPPDTTGPLHRPGPLDGPAPAGPVPPLASSSPLDGPSLAGAPDDPGMNGHGVGPLYGGERPGPPRTEGPRIEGPRTEGPRIEGHRIVGPGGIGLGPTRRAGVPDGPNSYSQPDRMTPLDRLPPLAASDALVGTQSFDPRSPLGGTGPLDLPGEPVHFTGHPLDVTPRFPPLPPLSSRESVPPLPPPRLDDNPWYSGPWPD